MKNIKKISEKGSALLIAMIMLVVLTIIGTATMNTSTTEVIISGNYRTMKDGFYNTEAPVEYAIVQSTIYSNIAITIGGFQTIPLAADNVASANLGGLKVLDNVTAGRVTLKRCGKPTTGTGDSGKMMYYHIDVTGKGPANAVSHQFVERGRPYPGEECP